MKTIKLNSSLSVFPFCSQDFKLYGAQVCIPVISVEQLLHERLALIGTKKVGANQLSIRYQSLKDIHIPRFLSPNMT